jgi:hypothetical protein
MLVSFLKMQRPRPLFLEAIRGQSQNANVGLLPARSFSSSVSTRVEASCTRTNSRLGTAFTQIQRSTVEIRTVELHNRRLGCVRFHHYVEPL